MSDTRLPSNSSVPAPSQGDIDASCRAPLLALFSGASVWLLVSAVASICASMTFHKPDMFADCMFMNYGRLQPFAKIALLYGFCLPAGYGLALWLAARLSRAKLACGVASTYGAMLWHAGVLVGSFAILCGASTGYEGFEIPKYASSILFAASLIFGYVGLSTIHRRSESELYPSLWFIITGLLWFPWILSTAIFALGVSPVRGVAQIAVQSWYLNNLQFVVLGLFGLAAAFYFMPKLSGKDLHSKYLALFALFALIGFGSWAGIPPTAPLPVWIAIISGIAGMLSLITAFAVIDNLRHTCTWKAVEPEAKFFSVSVMFFVAALLVGAIGVWPSLSHRLGLTLYHAGHSQLLVVGFFGMVALGGVYHVLPKVADIKWPFAGFVRAHFAMATAGVLIIAAGYLVGGWQHGTGVSQSSPAFVASSKPVLMAIRIVSLGEVLWALGGLLFTVNVFALVYQRSRACLKCCSEGETAMTASEVKA